MRIEVKSYSSTKSLLSSIITFVIGAVLFTKPGLVEKFFSWIIGGILIAGGLIGIIIHAIRYKKQKESDQKRIYFAFVYLLIGLFFLLFTNTLTQIIRYIIGAWILFFGINRLISAIQSRLNRHNIILFIISLIIIGLGLYTMLVPDLFTDAIGIMLMVYSGVDIIGYIFYSANLYAEKAKEGETTLIIPEKKKNSQKKKK